MYIPVAGFLVTLFLLPKLPADNPIIKYNRLCDKGHHQSDNSKHNNKKIPSHYHFTFLYRQNTIQAFHAIFGFEALVKTEEIGSFTALDIEPATIDEIVVVAFH